LKLGRNAAGIELSPAYEAIASERAEAASQPRLAFDEQLATAWQVVCADATDASVFKKLRDAPFDYCVTSPPYWSMLSNPGSENQRARREKNLSLVYSDDDRDVGNEGDYDRFLGLLASVYRNVAAALKHGGVLTVVVKNVKREHILYPLAWDLVRELAGPSGQYEFVGHTLWCQDDVGLKPFAVGTHWVSNILHQYCLHFCRRC
jgi:hypothetical protein